MGSPNTHCAPAQTIPQRALCIGGAGAASSAERVRPESDDGGGLQVGRASAARCRIAARPAPTAFLFARGSANPTRAQKKQSFERACRGGRRARLADH